MEGGRKERGRRREEGRKKGNKEVTRQKKICFYHYYESLLTKFSDNDTHSVKSFERCMGNF